jgi:pimeloyl-ACP methyl ester carboxylesterase
MGTSSAGRPPVFVRSADGVSLALTVTLAQSPADVTIVLVPGFSEWAEKPGLARATAVFAEHADVVQVDLRGHGRSGGLSTLADREVLDVDAAVAYARKLSSRPVVTVGFSIGGGAVLRHAALVGERLHGHAVVERVDAVVCVSTGTDWDMRDTRVMRWMRWLTVTTPGRLVARAAYQVRIDPAGWSGQPLSPVKAAASLRVPLLVVQGDRDAYVKQEHAHRLAAAAREAGTDVQLWIEPGFGHAEEAADPALLRRIGAALPAMTAVGQ